MVSERIQRQIDRLLDEAEAAIAQSDWARVQDRAENVLALDPDNSDARAYLAAAERRASATPANDPAATLAKEPHAALLATPAEVGAQHAVPLQGQPSPPLPTAFVSGRYQVQRFLGEGGKKKVYLAHDTLLDRDVAFALIKTDGLDDAGRERIAREAQAMGAEVTPRSDLYSLGAMLYELVCGRPPFIGEESVAIITQHLNVPPVAPTWHNPSCPPALEALILRLLEKDPAKRPSSAKEVDGALGNIAAAGAHPHPASPASWEPKGAPNANVGASPRGRGDPSLSQAGEGEGEGESQAQDGARAALDNPLYRQTFVGREQELRQAKAAFDGAMSGQGGLVMVAGEPGIGETALCEQLATYVTVRGGKALVGHSYEEGSLSLPYLPFVEALHSYVLARDPEALRGELASGAADVARIVSEIRDRIHVDARPAGDPEDERWRLYQAVTGFLRNASGVQPLLLVLEDLHWADRGTLDYLVHLSRNLAGARLLIVGTYRDVEVDRAHPLSATLAELRRASSFARIPLRGLTPDEVHRMLNNFTGQEVRWSLAEAVHRQTEGSPLFVQEVLRYLVEEGLITHEGGRWHRAGDAPPELSIPEGLRDVIGKRLSRPSPEFNRLLTIAAVIGRDFQLSTLRSVAELPEETVLQGLEETLHVGVLEERSRPGVVQYRFSHAFFRQTLYEEQIAPRRIRLHQQVGRVLESQYAARLEDHAAELAEHFAQSGDPDDLRKAVQYGELAARRALAVAAYGEAVRLLEQALDVQEVLDLGDTAKRCDLLLTLAAALMPAGELRHVLDDVAPEALALAVSLGDGRRASQACTLALESLDRSAAITAWTTPEGRQWAERADRHALPGTTDRVYADIAVGDTRTVTGSLSEAEALYQRALELARQIGEADTLFFAAAKRIQFTRDVKAALPLMEEIAASPREGVGARNLGLFLFRLGFLYLSAGERDRAEQTWAEIDALATRSPDANVLLRPYILAPVRAMLDGRLEEAAEAGKQLISRGEELGEPAPGRGMASNVIPRPLLYLGRADEAMALMPDVHQVLSGQRVVSPYLIEVATMSLAHLARRDEAKALLERMMREAGANAEEGSLTPWGLAMLLEAAVLLEEREAAAVLAGWAEPLAPFITPTATGTFLTCVARHLGAAAALLGQPEQARAYYEQALDVATRARFRPEIALIHLQMAELDLPLAPGPSREPKGTWESVRTPNVDVGASSAVVEGASPSGGEGRNEAMQHLDFAIAELREMKMQPALERALRHKELLKA